MMVFSKSFRREWCWSWNCGSEAKGNLDPELVFLMYHAIAMKSWG